MRQHCGRRGSALIEAAFILPVFGLVACGTVDMARTLYLQQVTHGAARAGAHRALLSLPQALDFPAIEQAAQADAGPVPVKARATRVCACSPGGESSGCGESKCSGSRSVYVQVEASASVATLLPYPGRTAGLVRAEVLVRVE